MNPDNLPQPGHPDFEKLIHKSKQNAKDQFMKNITDYHQVWVNINPGPNGKIGEAITNSTPATTSPPAHQKAGTWPPKKGTFECNQPSLPIIEMVSKEEAYKKFNLLQFMCSELHCQVNYPDDSGPIPIGDVWVNAQFGVCWACLNERMTRLERKTS